MGTARSLSAEGEKCTVWVPDRALWVPDRALLLQLELLQNPLISFVLKPIKTSLMPCLEVLGYK